MALKLNSASGSITISAEDGSGNADVTFPRAGYEPADATILKSASIGSTVQAYDADTTKNDVANTFTADQTISANLGIGGTPSYNLHIIGNDPKIFLEDNAGSPTGNWSIRSADDQLVFRDESGSADIARLTSAGDFSIDGELTVDSYNESYNAVTSTSNAATVDCETGNVFSHTLTENTTFTFSNPPASGTAYAFSLRIIQDASASGYTVTWPAAVDWPSATAPTLTATASAVDWFVFSTVDGGTTWYGFTSGQALG